MNGIAERPPRRTVVRVIELAALVLPPGDIRRRYEREFYAELHGLDGRQQARYALGVLATVWSLRAAVTSEDYDVLEASMAHVDLRRPILCRLNLHHHWQRGFTEDGVATPTAPRAARSSATTSVLPARRRPGRHPDDRSAGDPLAVSSSRGPT
jgi:hypothetical protein